MDVEWLLPSLPSLPSIRYHEQHYIREKVLGIKNTRTVLSLLAGLLKPIFLYPFLGKHCMIDKFFLCRFSISTTKVRPTHDAFSSATSADRKKTPASILDYFELRRCCSGSTISRTGYSTRIGPNDFMVYSAKAAIKFT